MPDFSALFDALSMWVKVDAYLRILWSAVGIGAAIIGVTLVYRVVAYGILPPKPKQKPKE